MPRITKKKSSRKVSFKKSIRPFRKSSSKRKSSKKRAVKKRVFVKKSSKKISYMSNIPSAIRGTARGAKYGASAGSYFGPYGTAVGSALGGIAGGTIGLITGHGDYTVQSNSLTNPGQQIPSFDSQGRHCVRVKHREYIGDLTGSTSPFTNVSYSFNPGNKYLFPWLSTIANNFEEYAWSGAVVELRSISGVSVGSTNEALGYQAMGAEYNASLPAFVSKLQLENSEFSVSGPPSANVLLPIECKRSETAIGELYVNNGGIPSGQDARLYDHCLLNIACGNQQAAYKISEIWISYDVVLYKPKFGYSTNSVNMYHGVAGLGMSTSAYFGTTQITQENSSFVPTLTGTTITFPANIPLGSYMLYYSDIGSTTAGATPPTVNYTSNCKALNILANDTISQFIYLPVTTSGIMMVAYFEITGPSAVITFSGGVLPTSGVSMDLIITQLNSRITT
jgi:hypothetical protein